MLYVSNAKNNKKYFFDMFYNPFHLKCHNSCIMKKYKVKYYRSLLESTQVSFARYGKKRPVVV